MLCIDINYFTQTDLNGSLFFQKWFLCPTLCILKASQARYGILACLDNSQLWSLQLLGSCCSLMSFLRIFFILSCDFPLFLTLLISLPNYVEYVGFSIYIPSFWNISSASSHRIKFRWASVSLNTFSVVLLSGRIWESSSWWRCSDFHKSHESWALSQNSEEFPNRRGNLNAITGVIERRSLNSSLTVWRDTIVKRKKARSLFCCWTVKEFGITMTELSEQLKNSFSALSPLTKRGESAFFGKKTGQAMLK